MTRTRLLAVAVISPLIVTTVALIIGVALLADLGRDIAVHWGIDGRADGFAPAWAVVVGAGVLGVAIPLLVGLLTLEHGDRPLSAQNKLVAVVPLFLAGVLGGILVWIAATQRGDAAAPEVWTGLLIGLGSGLVLAAAGWFTSPRIEVRGAASPASAEPALPLADDERAVWVARTSLSRRARAAIAVLVLVLLGAVLAATAVTEGAMLGLIAVPVVLVVLFAFTASWTVRVDRSGLLVRSVLGWPRFHVRTDEIESAGVSTVSPLAEFGGWGIRWGAGRRFGVVTRGGDALEVTVRGDRRFVVTVDDAATAAGLLTAVRAR